MYALPSLALVFPLLLPSVVPPPPGEPAATAAADDDCAKSAIELDVDVESGIVHAFDGAQWTTLDGDLVVYAGDQSRVAVAMHYSTGEWVAEISADGASPVRVATRDGVLRFWLDPKAERYVIASTADEQGASTMLAMTPVVPDVIIRPTKDCPPPT